MSLRDAARELSRYFTATENGLSQQIIYRELRGRTILASQGTITYNWKDTYTRCYLEALGVRERIAGAGVINRGDLIFYLSEDKITPRSEEDEIYLDIYHWGTISINRNATRLTGASVAWSVLNPDDRMRLASQGTLRRVASVINTAGTLTLSEAYGNATLAAATYRIYRPYQVVGWGRSPDQAEWEIHGRHIA